MMTRKSLLAAACLTIPIAAFAQPSSSQSPSPMTPSRAMEMTLSNQDKDFFSKAASSGLMEVQAGKLASSNTQNAGVRQFADMMVKDHSKLNDELQSLAQSKGVSLPSSLNDKDADMMESLQKATTGKDFDKDYVKDQVKVHKNAIDLFDNAARNSKDPDIRSFAAKALPTLERHGTEAKALDKNY